MGKFFQQLMQESLIVDWAETLDWLLDDNRFDKNEGWTCQYVGSFTKKIKKMPGFSSETFIYATKAEVVFPDSDDKKYPFVVMKKDDGQGRNFIRHIRNGIAHGKAEVFKRDGKLLIRIIDYGKVGVQTAYICMPVDYIKEAHKFYRDVEKSKNHQKAPVKSKKRAAA